MAKNLILVRHAKSDWGNFELKDFDRPLNPRGITDAPEMGKRLFQKNISPDAIISSPALRAITTAQLIADEIAFPAKKIMLNQHIYQANELQLLSIVNHFDNAINLVALFGHNPGLSMLAKLLTDAAISDMPTCGIVMIEFDVDDWQMIAAGTGDILWEDYPKKQD